MFTTKMKNLKKMLQRMFFTPFVNFGEKEINMNGSFQFFGRADCNSGFKS